VGSIIKNRVNHIGVNPMVHTVFFCGFKVFWTSGLKAIIGVKYRIFSLWKTFAVRGRLYNEKAILISKEKHKVHHLMQCSARWSSLGVESGRGIYL
jgi:hypothetical protein